MGTHYSYAGKGAVLVTSLNPILTFIIMTVIVKKINFKEIFGITVGLLGGLIIMDVFSVNIYILTQNEILDIYEPYPIGNFYDSRKNTIFLIHENNAHFKLLGHFDDIMITYFNHNNVPQEMKMMFNLK